MHVKRCITCCVHRIPGFYGPVSRMVCGFVPSHSRRVPRSAEGYKIFEHPRVYDLFDGYAILDGYNRGFRRANRGLNSVLASRRPQRLLNQLSQSAVLTG